MFYDNTYCNIASCADDSAPYCSDSGLEKVVKKLWEKKTCTSNLFKWFQENHMKGNADKCHFLVTSKSPVSANIEEFIVKNSNEEKLLGVKIDTKLSFKHHVSSLCKEAS